MLSPTLPKAGSNKTMRNNNDINHLQLKQQNALKTLVQNEENEKNMREREIMKENNPEKLIELKQQHNLAN